MPQSDAARHFVGRRRFKAGGRKAGRVSVTPSDSHQHHNANCSIIVDTTIDTNRIGFGLKDSVAWKVQVTSTRTVFTSTLGADVVNEKHPPVYQSVVMLNMGQCRNVVVFVS